MDFEALEIGQSASFEKTVTEADIVLFAGVTGDTNPAHLSEDFAAGTMFKTRIAHGMLSAGFISAVLGTKLPGPGTIYLGQTLNFKAPVKIGDTVLTTVTIESLDPKRRKATFDCACRVGDTVVTQGTATVMLPK
ncbi:MAG: MaoC family dehydratase [Pseudomonadota bacterium]